MSLQNEGAASINSNRPLVLEFGIVTTLLVGVSLWRAVVEIVLTAVFGRQLAIDTVILGGLVNGGILLVGLTGFAAAYCRFREADIGVRLPARQTAPLVGLAVLTPVACVAVTKLVGVATGVPYNSLTKTSVAADAPLLPVLLVTGLGVVLGVPMLVLICQALVQTSFEQVVSANTGIVLTTAVTGFAMVSNTGGLAAFPEPGRLIGTVIFTVTLGVAAYTNERAATAWLRYLGFVPVVLVGAGILVSGTAGVETFAGGVFATTQLAVLGLAAYTYDRTASLLVPTLSYAALLLCNRAVVFFFEAGMQSW